MVNKAFLIGNMGNDPTVRQAGESKVASFTLATSDRVKKNGEYVNETTWHNIVVWGKQADFVEKYLKKGSMIHVEGKINNRSYEDKDGNKKYISEIIAHEVKSLSHKKDDDSIPMP